MEKKNFDLKQYLNKSVIVNINRPNRHSVYRGELIHFSKHSFGTVLMLKRTGGQGKVNRWVNIKYDTDSIAIENEKEVA